MSRLPGQLQGHTTKLRSAAFAALVLVASQAAAQQDAQPAATRPTDANIASLLTTANQGEIQTAELALEKSRNEQVRSFAQRMITDHQWANDETTQLLQRINVTPAPMETSRELEANTQSTLESLRGMNGAAFDRAYIESQVTMHEWLIQTFDSMLIPGSHDEELEEWLVQLRPTINEHLQEARQIQATIGDR